MPPAGDFLSQLGDRIQNSLGAEFFKDLFPIDEEREGLKLQGFIGYPASSRQNRAEQYLFINRRAVVSPLVSYAIKEGYGPALPANRHPIYVLHLSLPTEYVDINVHPQKREVRLAQDLALKEMILSSLQRSFNFQESAPAMEISLPAQSFHYEPYVFPEIKIEREVQREFLFEAPKEVYAAIPKVLTTINRFILVKTPEDQLALVDQKAAKSRILYEQLIKEQGRSQSQILLFPYTLDVNPLEANVIAENMTALNEMGFDIQEIGKNCFAIHAIPATLEEKEVEALIMEMAHQLQESLGTEERKKKLAQIASRYASAKALSDMEARMILQELMRCDITTYCPHGKPIMATLGQEDLTTLFSKKSCIKKE